MNCGQKAVMYSATLPGGSANSPIDKMSHIAVGALAGTAVGWLVPWLHFHGTLPAPAGAEGLSWTLSPTSNGVVATGVF